MTLDRYQLAFVAVIVLCMVSLISCDGKTSSTTKGADEQIAASFNPVVYFEIPVTDVDRAIAFYSAVFKVEFEKEVIDHNEMALFPFYRGESGISGALAKGEIYKPTKEGVLIYFKTLDIDHTLKLAIENGAKVLYPKTDNGLGFVAEFEDSEGNRIALFQAKA